MAIRGNIAGIRLNIDASGLLDTKRFGLDEKAVKRAEMRAINKTVRWLKAQMARLISKDVGVAQKHIKRRIYASLANAQKSKAVFWMGVGGINPMKLGLTGRKLKTGYKVGRFRFKDGFRAFYKNRWDGKDGMVFRRVGDERLPIQEMDINVRNAASTALDRLFNRAEVELLKKLRQELAFEMKKSMGSL